MLGQQGEVPPLDEVPAHGADYRGLSAQKLPHPAQLAEMPAMQGIILCYDTSDGHRIPPDPVTKE